MKFTRVPLSLLLTFIFLSCVDLPKSYANTSGDICQSDDPVFQIWVDTLSKITAYDKIAAQDFRYETNFKLGSPNYAYWIYFQLKNASSDTSIYWLHAGVYDSLSLLIKDAGSSVITEHRGLQIGYDEKERSRFRHLQADKYGFELALPPFGTVDAYLRIKNTIRFEGSIDQLHIRKLTTDTPVATPHLLYYLVYNAAFFGIFLFLICFSLLQYLQNRDTTYLSYVLYLSLCLLYFWWKFEKSNSFLNLVFTELPQYYYHVETPLSILIYISYFAFIARFLNAKKDLPGFYRVLSITAPALLLYTSVNIFIASTVSLSLSWELGYWMRAILIPLSVLAIYQVFKTKHKLALYALSGTLFMLLGAMITSVYSKILTQHYVGPWDIPLLPIQIGILVEVLFFAVGLGYKGRLTEQERRAMQINLQQREKEADFHKTRKEELRRLYTNLSHEFRTPLTVITGLLQQIKGHQKEKEMIRRNGNQLLMLINQVLDLNKLDESKMQVNWKQSDVMSYIKYCVEPFELMSKSKKQTLEIFCFPKKLVMDFDAEKLQKIINNLLSNAIKFTPAYGQIRIDAYQEKKGNEAFLRLDVSDSGIGIPSADQQMIFDHYTQLPGTEGGTGLGLALVKELTLLLGGQIHLNSASGKGSVFQLSFPVHHQAELLHDLNRAEHKVVQQEAPKETLLPLDLKPGRPTLLIVEDNDDVQQYLGVLLQRKYNIFYANNGKKGLEKVVETRPDIIISDVMMPEMNGYEFCRYLKSKAGLKHIPILLLTAKADQQDKREGYASLADAYLTKPFDEEELHIRLEQLLTKNKILEERKESIFVQSGLIEKVENSAVLLMDKLHQVLKENLQNEGFKIKDLCRAMNMNHVTLNNNIKKHTQQTTAQYIRNYRLNLAKELLRSTDLSVAEISYRVGISEPSNFNTMFKRSFGKSPKQWKLG